MHICIDTQNGGLKKERKPYKWVKSLRKELEEEKKAVILVLRNQWYKGPERSQKMKRESEKKKGKENKQTKN